jgi:hypothetical protein
LKEKLSLEKALDEETPKGQKRTADQREIMTEDRDTEMKSNTEEDNFEMEEELEFDNAETNKKNKLQQRIDQFLDRTKYIPLRLNETERKQLRLIEAALSVSDYTGKVDIISYEKKSKRSFEQLREMCAVLSGLLVASDYTLGQRLIAERNFKDNAEFFQTVFEIGRRYVVFARSCWS